VLLNKVNQIELFGSPPSELYDETFRHNLCRLSSDQ